MDEEGEEIERNINNITCDTPFQSPVTKNVQKKDANWSLKDDLMQAFLTEWLKNSMNVLSNQTNRSTQ